MSLREELKTILGGVPPGVLSMTGGFPNPATFPAEVLEDLLGQVLRRDAAVALQYTPVEGLRSVREYLCDRIELTQGRRPAFEEVLVTSGGMECIALVCQSLLEAGDTVAVEAPTYLGALMAFDRYGLRVEGIPMDGDGIDPEALRSPHDVADPPSVLYVIPEFQNPTGRTLSLERRQALVDVCRERGITIFEDVAYRELAFDGENLPSLWSLAPDIVVQAGTFSKIFFPGVRLGWAVGRPEVVAELAAAKQTTDQCAGALGQRLLEAYGRAGHFEVQLPAARAMYATHWLALRDALERHMPEGCTWTEPDGGFLTWLRLPEGLDATALRGPAADAGMAYVPGRPFYATDEGHDELRLSFSSLGPDELDRAIERLAGVVREASSRG